MPREIGQGGGPQQKKKPPAPPEQGPPPQHPINQRAGVLPPNFVKENPLSATSLVFSNLPTSILTKFGQGIAQNYDWMKSVSGPGGMFMTARARAYTLTDPKMRLASLGVIDALQQATESSHVLQQEAAQQPVSRLRASEHIQAQGAFKYDNNGTRIEVDPTNKIVVLPTNDTQDPTFRQAYTTVHELFPDWQIQVVSANDNVRGLHEVTGLIGKGFDAATRAQAWAIDQTLGRTPGPIGREVKRLTTVGTEATNVAFGRGEDLLTGAVAQTGYYMTGNFHPIPKDWYWPAVPAVDGSGHRLTWWEQQQAAGSAFGNWVADSIPTDPLHDPFGMTHRGLSPNNPARETIATTADLALTLGLAHSGGEFARGFKEGRTAVLGDNMTSIFDKVNTDGRVRGVFNQAGFDLTSRPISQWGETKTWERLARTIDAAKAKHGDKAGAVLTKRLSQDTIPTQLANIIDRFDNGHDAAAAILRYAQNAPDTEYITKLAERKAAIDRELRGDLRLTPEGEHLEKPTYSQRINQLKAEKARIEDEQLQIGPSGDRAPITKLPTRAVLDKARLQESKIGQIAHVMYNPPVRWAPHLSRLFDSIGRTVIRDPFGPASLEGRQVFRENEQTMRSFMGRIGVPEDIIDSVVDQMGKVTDSNQHFELMKRVGTIIDKEGRFLSADSRGHMSRIFKEQNPNVYLRSQIERTIRDPVTGKDVQVTEGVLPTDVQDGRYDQPSQTAEMLGDFHLPSANSVVEATSLTRQMVRYFRNHKATAPLGLTLDTMFFLSRVLTAYGKVAILAPRAIPYGALFWRIQGEQALREKLYGYRIFSDDTLARWHLIRDHKSRDFTAPTKEMLNAKILNWANGESSHHDLDPSFVIKREDDGTYSTTATVKRRSIEEQRRARTEVPNQNLGSLMLNYEQGPATAKDWRAVQMVDPTTRSLSDEGARAAMQRIIYRAQSVEQRKLVELGGNPDAFVKWLNQDVIGRKVKRMFSGVVQKADLGDLKGDARFKEWGRRSYEAMKQETGGNAELLDAIRTGTWRYRDEAIDTIQSYDGQMAVRYRQKLDDLTNVRSALDDAFYARTDDTLRLGLPGISQAREGPRGVESAGRRGQPYTPEDAQIRALVEQRQKLIDELDTMEKEAGVKPETYQYGLLAPVARAGYYTPKKAARVGIAGQEMFMENLKSAYDRGEYKPPQTLNGWVPRAVDTDATKATIADKMRNWQGTQLYGLLANMTKADMRFTRGSLFTKITAEEYRRLRNLGYTDDQAFAHSKAYAARTTTDIMYDLTDRTSAQRALRNLFWFAPAYQELLTTWFVKIPSKYYWPVGAAVMYEQAHALLGLMKQVGIIQTDPNTKKDVIIIPGLGQALSKLTNSEVPDTVFGYTTGANMLSAGFPSPSLQGQFIIEAAAKLLPDSRVAQALNDWINQYTPATRSIPAAITYAWETAFGTRFPGEFLHPDYQDQLVALGHNAAMDQARSSLIQEGHPPPIAPGQPDSPYPDTGAGKNRYNRDLNAYRQELLNRANNTYKWWAAVALLGATISPMSLHVTDAYRQDAGKFYNSLFDKSLTAGEIAQQQQKFLDDHPGGIGYITTKSYLTGEGPKFPYTHPSQESTYQQMYDGARKVFTPAEYFTWLQGQESRRVLIGELQTQLDKLGNSGPDLLLNRYERNADIAQYHRSWDQYLWANDEPPAPGQRSFLDMWNDRHRIYEKLGVTPTQDFQASQVTEAYRLLDEYRGHFEPNGLSNSSYETVRSEFAKLMSETGQFGAPTTRAAKGMAWYMDKVYGPYLDHLQPLYAQANALAAQGKDPSVVYDEIRRYQEKYTRLAEANKIMGPDGDAYPDPQAVAYGNKSPAQRREDAIHYATEPVPWLTSFQRTQAGYDKAFAVDPHTANKFFAYQAWFDSWLQKYEDAHGISSYSNYGQELQKWRTQSLAALAQGNYPGLAKQTHIEGSQELLHMFRTSEGPPIGRLQALGYGKNEPGYQTFQQVAEAAQQATDAITKAGFSPSGDSQYAVQVKTWFYNIVDTARTKDQGFDSLIKDLSLALPIKDQYREGPLLYQAVYFDNFSTKVASVYYHTPKNGVGPYNVQKWERTYANGKVPDKAMTDIGRGYLLQPSAADAFEAAQAAAEKDNVNLLAGVISAYRDIAKQEELAQHPQGNPVADPGTSNHGWGLAIDVSSNSAAWRWLVNNGAAYGWAHRDPGGDPNHFTFDLAPGV